MSEEKQKANDSYSDLEHPIFEEWKRAGYFRRGAGFGKHADETYTIVIPPPNVTGVLHIGHALNDTIQDVCIRHARMQGKQTRWILGTDHAGIATQTRVDKYLASQGINRREIGREAFIEACHEWREKYGAEIVHQIASMGCSCDYDDEKFTMSEEFSAAVRKVFVDWYHDGIIYKGRRIVNWCPSCTTAIADDEAEYISEEGSLWYLRYPLTHPAGGREYLVVATTRPETMLGDSGVAVNPRDERYKDLIGKTVMLPIVGREIPVFADYYVDASFGTGAVKVTPAHDPNDFAMGERHGLEQINIFDETAHVVNGYGRFSGMDRDEARVAVVDEFERLGLLDHIEDHEHSVMHCYRCHTTLEPWLSEQWFVKVEGLKKPAAEAVESGQIRFYPPRWSQVYLDWLQNLKDWCISRQLWWGHRIPMFYCDNCGWMDASVEVIENCPRCGAALRQDEDVLDTWFSSQLWPFATQGWAEDGKGSEELRKFYPTQVLSTARDIMGLWVARMVMASEYCTGQIPFHDVIIHPTVLGADGKPMSKSRGNGVDPVDLMAEAGADGMRFGLLSQVSGTQAIRFDRQKIMDARSFANKIRNAARFIEMNLSDADKAAIIASGDTEGIELADISDRWIASRLANLVAVVDEAYASYSFSAMTGALYTFFWNEFCDWYIEFSKARISSDDAQDAFACKKNLVAVLGCALRLLHPIMPYLTEKIYGELPRSASSAEMLIVAPWPDAAEYAKYIDEHAESAAGMIEGVVGGVRSIRARYGISPKTPLEAYVKASDSDGDLLRDYASLIVSLARCSGIHVSSDMDAPSQSAAAILPDVEIYVPLADLIDIGAECARLEKERGKISAELERLKRKLSNEGYLSKAAVDIIEKDRSHAKELEDTLLRVSGQLEALKV